MSSDPRTVAFLVDQLARCGDARSRPMFGEYGLYVGDRMVAMVCDDRLFMKPTAAGRALAPDAGEGVPYPGAKPCLLVAEDRWEDADWLSELLLATSRALPAPQRRRRAAAGGVDGA